MILMLLLEEAKEEECMERRQRIQQHFIVNVIPENQLCRKLCVQSTTAHWTSEVDYGLFTL